MAYDGIMMHQVIDALNKTITGGRINKIYQISKYELLIQIRNNRTNYKLLLSCHPDGAGSLQRDGEASRVSGVLSEEAGGRQEQTTGVNLHCQTPGEYRVRNVKEPH